MKRFTFILAAVVTLLVFSGCAAQTAPTAGSALLPTLELLSTRTAFPTITQTLAPTATRTRIPTSTPTPTKTPTLIPTAVPVGTFAVLFYPPLTLSYHQVAWLDMSEYGNTQFMVNYLQSQEFATCSIGVQGPTDFNGPPEAYIWGEAQLGDQKFATLDFPEPAAQKSRFYFAEGELPGYDSSVAIPVLVITASEAEWDACKTVSEEVLATLRTGDR